MSARNAVKIWLDPSNRVGKQYMGDQSTRLSTPPSAKRLLAAARLETEKERDRANELQAEILALRRSLSWRLTTPLRATGALLKPQRWIARLLFESPAFSWIGKPLAKCIYAWKLPGSELLLPGNPLFSLDFYLTSSPDLKSDRNLWAHYLGFGADEGRDPHPLFSTSYYLQQNPDVQSRKLNPLVHYITHGAAENRAPHPSFDPYYYLAQRPDVKAMGLNPLLHYWELGRNEGSLPNGSKTPYRAHSSPVLAQTGLGPGEGPTGYLPLFSILLPVFNTPPEFLRLAIGSVFRQSYTRWQLCLYDDGSTREDTLAVLTEYATLRDSRVVIEFGNANLGIARASNAALALARGDYVGMLDHDDELDLDALLAVAELLRQDPSLDVVYTDQDYVDAQGRRIGTLLKPDWSPEMFRGVMFVNHLLVVRADLMRRVDGFNPSYDRIQDFEFMLRVSERTNKIGHVPRILYHWRSIPGSVAGGANSKGILEPLQARVVNDHLSRLGIGAVAAPHLSLSHRLTLRPAERSSFPRVVIAVREMKPGTTNQAIQSVLLRSTYPNLTVCVPPALLGDLSSDPRVIGRELEDVHGRITNEEFLLWMDGDLEVLTPDWIETLLMYCEQPDVACASPLITREGRVWCAGLVLGMNEGLGPVMRGLAPDCDGYAGSLSCSREVSAVSGECMMIRGAMFRRLGGSVKYYLNSTLDGADLALRAFTDRKRNIVTSQAVVQKHRAGVLREGWKLDEALFADRWSELSRQGDPFYNPQFVTTSPGYELQLAVGETL